MEGESAGDYAILVVDNRDSGRSMIEMTFKPLYTVESFPSGQDCLQRIAEKMSDPPRPGSASDGQRTLSSCESLTVDDPYGKLCIRAAKRRTSNKTRCQEAVIELQYRLWTLISRVAAIEPAPTEPWRC